MPGREYWLSIARSTDPDDLREHILTGFRSGKPFAPYVPTIAVPSPVARVLDFGCGVGRTFPYLKTIAGHLTGFDLPPMIERCRALAPEPADALLDDWEAVRISRFDLIVSVLVLQHIEPDGCRQYLEDFARMAPAVYMLTRANGDFDTNVLQTVADTGLFVAGDCIEVEHDPLTNQLRVIGGTQFVDACSPGRGGHFEVLLRSSGLMTPGAGLRPAVPEP